MTIHFGDNTSIATATGLGAGILQTLQTAKTDTFSQSLSSGSLSNVIMERTITPASSSNKILLLCHLNVSGNGGVGFQFTRGGSALAASTGDADSSRIRLTSQSQVHHPTQQCALEAVFLDSPSSTSQQTYGVKLYIRDNQTQTIYLNRSGSHENNAWDSITASFLICQEIAA